MGKAIVKISFPLLVEVLRFPKGTKISKITQENQQIFSILIEHSNLPEGDMLKLATPSWKVDETNRIEFMDWGIEK